MKTNPITRIDITVCQQRVEQYMQSWLNITPAPKRLQSAMSYSVLGGGKRLRPLLVYATGSGFGAELVCLDPAAVAVELIHCYSLVHDDLPAMDDDDLSAAVPLVTKLLTKPPLF